MSKQNEFEHVEVAVVVITRGEQILTVFNPRWGAYTLPMTKRRTQHDNRTAARPVTEEWEDTAIRARAEALQGTTTGTPRFLFEIPEYQQSDRDGQWKRFHFRVFRFDFDGAATVLAHLPHEWLTREEILDARRRPISKTARDIVAQARKE
jgi:hypothetical protein